MSKRSLKAIRRDAPVSDRVETALTPTEPQWAEARDGSRYVRVSIYPRTVDELRRLSREYGEAAETMLLWSCVVSWLMSGPDSADLSNPGVAGTAISLVQEHDRVRLGWPSPEGKPWKPSALEYLSPAVRAEAEQVAAETLSDWRRAGKPHLGETSIKRTYQYLVSCPAFANKYVRPLDANEATR